jgi:hypothetical protein
VTDAPPACPKCGDPLTLTWATFKDKSRHIAGRKSDDFKVAQATLKILDEAADANGRAAGVALGVHPCS